MKIKGIDLYKRVLEKDESILNKKFTNGKYIAVVSNAYSSESWKLSARGRNLLLHKNPRELDEIFLSEWKEVKEPVTWQEAIQAWIDGKTIKCIYKNEGKRQPSMFRLGLFSEDGTVVASGFTKRDFEVGKWYIED